MKLAPIIRSLTQRSFRDFRVVHTGQHYDYEMSRVFFEELELPKPDYFLNAGPGSHAVQTANVMTGFEKVCLQESPDLVVVVGDVNSTLACSITAKKLNIKVAHIEAGLRSMDMTMPEEVNRIVTDSISDLLFVSEKSGIFNLKKEGKRNEQIFFSGNVMIDTLFYQLGRLNSSGGNIAGTSPGEKYAVVTLHRPSNVDCNITCQDIIEALIEISSEMNIYFPVHPRTRKNLEAHGLMEQISNSEITLLPPLSYLDFLGLWKDASLLLTDSGGIQEESTALGIPCLTVRNNTERPVTLEEGTNMLVGNKKETILNGYWQFKNGLINKGKVPEFWDGKAAGRIVNILLNIWTESEEEAEEPVLAGSSSMQR